MARIPHQVAKRTLEVVKSPTYPVLDATAKAITGFGATVEDVAQTWKERQEQVDRFNSLQGLQRLGSGLSGAATTALATAPPDAAGYLEGMQKQEQEAFDSFIATVPAHLRPEFEQRLETMRAENANLWASVEAKQTREYQRGVLTENVDNARVAIMESGAAYRERLAAYRAELREYVDTTTLSPAEKAEFLREGERALEQAAANARLRAEQALGGGVAGGAGGPSPIPGIDITNEQQVPRSGGSPESRSFGGRRGRSDFHTGVDIPAPVGSPVNAIRDGVVVRADSTDTGGYGTVIDVRYADGTVHRAAHLGGLAPGIAVGSRVTAGQPLGTTGASGNADEGFPHVHYEVIRGEHYARTGGRPSGRASSRESLDVGRIDPRAYFGGAGGRRGWVAPPNVAPMIASSAQAAGLDVGLWTSVVGAESSFNPNAVSPSGARGYSQLLPSTAAELGVDINDPQQNLNGGARYLKQMLDKYGGDERLALMAYNWGTGNVDDWLAAGADVGDVPQETINYLNKVQGGGGGGGAGGDPFAGDPDFQNLTYEDRIGLLEEAERQRRVNARQYEDGLADETAWIRAGNDPTGRYNGDTAVSVLGNTEAAANVQREIDQAIEYAAAARAIQFASPEELARIAADATSALSQPDNFVDNARQAADIFGLIEDRQDAVKEDPAKWVLQDPGVSAAYNAMIQAQRPGGGDAAAVRASTAAYSASSLSLQDQMGIPQSEQRLLPDTAVAAIAETVKVGTGQNVAQTMRALQAQWGSQWPRVFEELSEDLPGVALVVGAMDRPDQALAAERLAEAAKVGREAYQDTLPSEKVTRIREALPVQLASFANTLAPTAGGGGRTFTAVSEAVRLLALSYARDDGDSGDAAVTRAVNDIIGKKYQINGTFRVPREFDVDDVSHGAATALSVATGASWDVPVSLVGLTEEEARASYVETLKADGFWVTSPDETGLSLYEPTTRSPVTINGEPMVIPFGELEKYARARYAPTATGVLNRMGVTTAPDFGVPVPLDDPMRARGGVFAPSAAVVAPPATAAAAGPKPDWWKDSVYGPWSDLPPGYRDYFRHAGAVDELTPGWKEWIRENDAAAAVGAPLSRISGTATISPADIRAPATATAPAAPAAARVAEPAQVSPVQARAMQPADAAAMQPAAATAMAPAAALALPPAAVVAMPAAAAQALAAVSPAAAKRVEAVSAGRAMTAETAARVTPAQAALWTPDTAAAVSSTALAALGPEAFAAVPPRAVAAIPPEAIAALPPAALAAMTPRQAAQVTPAAVAAMRPAAREAMRPAARAALPAAPAGRVPATPVARVEPTTAQAVGGVPGGIPGKDAPFETQPTRPLVAQPTPLRPVPEAPVATPAAAPTEAAPAAPAMRAAPAVAMTPAEAAALQPAAAAALQPASVMVMSPAAVAAMQPATLAALPVDTAEAVAAVSPAAARRVQAVSQGRALSPTMAARVTASTAAALTPDALAAVSPQAAAAFKPDAVAALKPDALGAMSPEAIGALTPPALAAMTPRQATQVTPEAAAAIGPEARAAMRPAARAALPDLPDKPDLPQEPPTGGARTMAEDDPRLAEAPANASGAVRSGWRGLPLRVRIDYWNLWLAAHPDEPAEPPPGYTTGRRF